MLYGKDAGYWDGEKLVAQLKDMYCNTSTEKSPSRMSTTTTPLVIQFMRRMLFLPQKSINLSPGGKNTRPLRDGWVLDEQGNKQPFPMNIVGKVPTAPGVYGEKGCY
jgi:hypothetical protein